MKPILLALAVVLAGLGPAAGESARDGIPAVISAQIEAFRAGDLARAFGFASEGIRGLFGTPETFGAMVERGYAMVIAPAEVDYGALRLRDGALWQMVLIEDADGTRHALDYRMVEEDGGWRISGVEILRRPGVGV